MYITHGLTSMATHFYCFLASVEEHPIAPCLELCDLPLVATGIYEFRPRLVVEGFIVFLIKISYTLGWSPHRHILSQLMT